MRSAELWQIRIEKAQGVRRFNDANAGGALLIDNLIAKNSTVTYVMAVIYVIKCRDTPGFR
jgi:hypothetical protein